MRLLFDVIDELYRFAVGSLLSIFDRSKKATESLELLPSPEALQNAKEEDEFVHESEEKLTLSTKRQSDQQTTGEDIKNDVTNQEVIMSSSLRQNNERKSNVKQTEWSSVKDIVEASAFTHQERGMVMYVGVERAPVFQDAKRIFDGVIFTLEYGEMVLVREWKGRFARVALHGKEGWVLRDELVDRASYVYPSFVEGLPNVEDDVSTVRLRAIIKDEYYGGLLEYPLQAGEYVTYRLKRAGKKIPWSNVRPRNPGNWHRLLRGVDDVYMSISPTVGSVMEYMIHDSVGHVAFVETVSKDQEITVSEVNYPKEGMYSKRVLSQNEWKELRPVFITLRA